MQNSVPKGQGGMVAVLGATVEVIEKILIENKENLKVQIANDNSEGQIVLSGKTEDLEKLIKILKDNSIKNIRLPVSAPFHCELMSNATKIMTGQYRLRRRPLPACHAHCPQTPAAAPFDGSPASAHSRIYARRALAF